MEKFTNGGWVIFGDWGIKDCNGRVIAQFEPLCDDTSNCNTDESFANAHLIAAAPEMYNFIKKCSLAFASDYPSLRDSANELLAKARGEQ